MKITIYTISDCQFSQAEKEYLKKHNLSFEEKNLEQNREWLTEMLTLSNNFAGTPVTKIEKDDGKIEVLKGFTQEEFDQVLGFKKEESVAQASADLTFPQSPQPPTPEPQTQPPPISQPPTPTPTPPTSQPTQPTTPPPPTPSTSQASTNPTVNQSENTPPPTPFSPPINPSFNESTSNQPNDPLKTILTDLQNKANDNQSSFINQPTTNNLPDIPNPDFK